MCMYRDGEVTGEMGVCGGGELGVGGGVDRGNGGGVDVGGEGSQVVEISKCGWL